MLREFSEPRLHEDNEPNEPRLDPDETERVLSDKLKETKHTFLNFFPLLHSFAFFFDVYKGVE